MAEANLNEVFKFFKGDTSYNMSTFRTDWAALSAKDKAEIKEGIGNGTLNY